MFHFAHNLGVAAEVGLELDCGMGDFKPGFQCLLYFAKDRLDLVNFLIVYQDMGAEGENIGTDAPYVQFVYVLDGGYGSQRPLDFLDRDAFRDGFKQYVEGGPYYFFCDPDQEYGDGYRDKRVNDIPLCV